MGKMQTRRFRDGPLDVEILRTGTLFSLHANPRHLPAGPDPLPVGVPSSIGVANLEGVAESFSRRDHVHEHPAGLGPNLHHDPTTIFRRLIYPANLGVELSPILLGGLNVSGWAGYYTASYMEVPFRCQIDRIGICPQQSNSGNFMLGFHSSDVNFLPDALACQTASLGVAANLILDRWCWFTPTTTPIVEPGVFWVGFICDTDFASGVAGMQCRSTNNLNAVANTEPADGIAVTYEQNVGAFAVPNPMVEAFPPGNVGIRALSMAIRVSIP